VRLSRLTILVALAAVAAGACSAGSPIRVGAGTTLVDSGVAEELFDRYDGDVAVVGGSSAEVLELLARGAVDIAITHDPMLEGRFLEANENFSGSELFASTFLLAGPIGLIDFVAGMTPRAAFELIRANSLPFVTRADGSGTYSKELELWGDGREPPAGDWYKATGQGMGLTLQVADQRDAFVLVEQGAFLAAGGVIDLQAAQLVPEGDELANPYSVTYDPSAGGGLVDWLLSAEAATALVAANEVVLGRQIYVRP